MVDTPVTLVEEAAALLASARARYATCTTYADSGTVVIEYRQQDGATSRAEFTFTTAFSRPDRFRFEWGERSPEAERGREVVVHEEGVVRSWPLGASEPVRCTSLVGALANDAGGAAPLVAALLMPDRFDHGGRLAPTSATAEAHRVVLEGVECWRFDRSDGDIRQRLWFEIDSRLLRRLEESQSLGGVEVVTTTTYAPRFDGRLAADDFALTEPAAERRLDGGGALLGPVAAGAFVCAALFLLISVLLRRRRAT